MVKSKGQQGGKGKTEQRNVQSLVRGLNLLVAVNEHSPATVTKLVAASGLPKATVIRLLRTLSNEGYIEMDKVAGGYKAQPKVRLLASPMISDTSFAIHVRHLLNDFAQIVKWPTEFLMPEGSAMVVQASNRTTAPIHLKRFEQARFPMLASASGLALLSVTPPAKRQQMINAVVSLEASASAVELTEQVYRDIEAAQLRGYALWQYNVPIEGTQAISIPLIANGEPYGALSLVILHKAVSEHQLNDFLLPQLHAAAEAIGKIYIQHGDAETLAPMSSYGISPTDQ